MIDDTRRDFLRRSPSRGNTLRDTRDDDLLAPESRGVVRDSVIPWAMASIVFGGISVALALSSWVVVSARSASDAIDLSFSTTEVGVRAQSGCVIVVAVAATVMLLGLLAQQFRFALSRTVLMTLTATIFLVSLIGMFHLGKNATQAVQYNSISGVKWSIYPSVAHLFLLIISAFTFVSLIVADRANSRRESLR